MKKNLPKPSRIETSIAIEEKLKEKFDGRATLIQINFETFSYTLENESYEVYYYFGAFNYLIIDWKEAVKI